MLIEIRVQLNGTLRQDIDRVASAINVVRRAMRVPETMVTFGPMWECNEYGQVCAVKYRCSDTHEAGDYRIWDLKPGRQLEFNADAQGGAVAA